MDAKTIKTIIGYSLSVSMVVGGMFSGSVAFTLVGICGILYTLK